MGPFLGVRRVRFGTFWLAVENAPRNLGTRAALEFRRGFGADHL